MCNPKPTRLGIDVFTRFPTMKTMAVWAHLSAPVRAQTWWVLSLTTFTSNKCH